MYTSFKLRIIRWWFAHRRLTKAVLFICSPLTLRGIGGKIKVQFENYRDLKTFREIFLEKQYKLNICEPRDIAVIVDIGSNVGYSAAYFFLSYPCAKIYTAEPVPETFERLEYVAKQDRRIIAEQVAIAGANGFTNMHCIDGATASSSIFSRVGETATIKVRTKTLREFLEGVSEVDILKIDVEGAEQFILKDPAINKARYIIAEIHPDLMKSSIEDLLKYLQNFNIHMEAIGGGRSILMAERKDVS